MARFACLLLSIWYLSSLFQDALSVPCFTELGRQLVMQYTNESLPGDGEDRPCIYVTPLNNTPFGDESIEQVVMLRLRPCGKRTNGNSSRAESGRQVFFDFGLNFYDYYEYYDTHLNWFRSDAWQEPFKSRGLITDCPSSDNETAATINPAYDYNEPENATFPIDWLARSEDIALNETMELAVVNATHVTTEGSVMTTTLVLDDQQESSTNNHSAIVKTTNAISSFIKRYLLPPSLARGQKI